MRGHALILAALIGALAVASSSAEPATAPAGHVAIPDVSYLYRFKLEREVVKRFGTQKSVARIAAQVHQESLWKSDARSPFAEGLAQFTPDTATWLQNVCPEIGPADVYDPNWSVRAVVCYDKWLHGQVNADTPCARWAMTLSSYNGGLGWVQRDQRKAVAMGLDAGRWFGQVEVSPDTRRAAHNIRQNRGYVRRILRLLEPAYIAAGWPGVAVCA